MGVSLCIKERRPGVPGPQRQGKIKLALKSGLKTHLHCLKDDFKSACRWVIAGHTLTSALYNNEFLWLFSLPGISFEDVEN